MYDIVHLDDETKEKLEEMLEHIIELDDLKNGWVKSDFSMTQKALEEVQLRRAQVGWIHAIPVVSWAPM